MRYTRDGQLVLDSTGRLQTPTGYLVLDTNGQPIKAGSADGLQVAADGLTATTVITPESKSAVAKSRKDPIRVVRSVPKPTLHRAAHTTHIHKI